MRITDYPATNTISTPENIASIMYAILSREEEIDQDKEHFWVIGLNTANHIKYIELVTLGILDSTLIHPREIFRLAIMQGVKSIILAHNHPGDNLKPSTADEITTQNLVSAGEILNIQVLDHLIIGRKWTMEYKNYHSWKESGGIK